MSIKVQFAVDMTCQSCVDDIGQILSTTSGVTSYDISLADKTVIVEGTASPTHLLNAFKDSGRSAVVRGTGSTSGNIGAAVCIFEEGRKLTDQTKGLARFVQVTDTLCFVDISVSGIPDGDHGVAIHVAGDLSCVPESCGPHWNPDNEPHGDRAQGHRGDLGNITVKGGWGDLTFETERFKVWEIIGRSMVIAEGKDDLKSESSSGKGILAGVVARSAGLFENDKQVCACSGNTLWTEQRLVDEGRRL